MFYDLLTRAHLIHCLSEVEFWDVVVRGELPPTAVTCVADFCAFMVSRAEQLALSEQQQGTILELARR